MLLLGATLGLTSCDDYLDKEPESNVTPASYFTSADDLAAYTVNLYGVLTSINPGSYGMSTFAYDNDTDNQAGTGYSNRWVPGNWKVGQSGGAWDFGNIRSVNYFFDQVVPYSGVLSVRVSGRLRALSSTRITGVRTTRVHTTHVQTGVVAATSRLRPAICRMQLMAV